MYLLLKRRAAAFRADPEVARALEAARVGELRRPTLDEGESYRELPTGRPTRTSTLEPTSEQRVSASSG
jgi:xylose isomerase